MLQTAILSSKAKEIATLVAILLCSFFLRTISLESIPKGLQADEASFLFNATALLETGRDEDNRQLPLYLESLIDSKPALYAYLQIPFIAVLGSTTEASRLPSAVLGTISIFLVYLLVRELLKKHWLALLSAVMLCFSPWHIMNSRATQEVIMSFTFLVANIYLFSRLYQAQTRSWKVLLGFFVTGVLAMYSYHATKVVLVGWYGFLALSSLYPTIPIRVKKLAWTALGLVLVGFAITAAAAFTRFSAIGLLHDDLPKAQIFEATVLATGETPLALIRLFYNKPVFYGFRFIEQYVAHFDLSYLFVSGGATKRFAVPYHGLFYLLDAVLLALGVYQVTTKKTYRWLRIPLVALVLLAPVPAALTTEEIPSSIRAFTLLLPLVVVWVLGVEKLLKIRLQTLRVTLGVVLTAGYIWSIGFFLQQLFVAMPKLNVEYRSRQYELLTEKLAADPARFSSITFTNDLREMYIYLWRAGLLSIESIQAQPKSRYSDTYQVGSFVFTQQQCLTTDSVTTEYIVSPVGCEESRQDGARVVDRVYFDDGETPAFSLLTSEKN